MSIIITGSSGFIGQALCNKFNELKIKYIGLSRSNCNSPRLVTVSDYTEAPSGDVLIHLAECSDRHLANQKGSNYEEKSLFLLQTLINKKYRKIIYASSAVLYGDKNPTPRKIRDPVFVTDTYTRIKYASEQIVLANQGIAVRLANVYGARMAQSNVINTIFKQLSESGVIQIQNTTPVRDFIWIEDVVTAIVTMIHNNVSGIFNVGSGIGTQIGQLANLALDVAGQSNRKVVSISSCTKPSTLILDISETSNILSWQPVVPIHCGIQQLLKLQIAEKLIK